MKKTIYTLYGSYIEDPSCKMRFYSTDDIGRLKIALQALMIPESVLTSDRVEDNSPVPMYWSVEELNINVRPPLFTNRYCEIREAAELMIAMGGYESD